MSIGIWQLESNWDLDSVYIQPGEDTVQGTEWGRMGKETASLIVSKSRWEQKEIRGKGLR